METLPEGWWALWWTVFALGLRHGLDADHLATIDGLSRYNAADHPRAARWCGFLFSLGHGLVVTVVAVLLGAASQHWVVPAWMEDVGAWISISVLLLLGVLNLAAVLRARPGEMVGAVGLKGRWLGRLRHARHPALFALVGALFALSFDTMSQTTLFVVAATQYGGALPALLLGLTFMAGMMITDGINGLWISRLLRRADEVACLASRVMGLTVAVLSLAVAGLGLGKHVAPDVVAWSEGRGLLLSGGVLLFVMLGSAAAVWAARPRPLKT